MSPILSTWRWCLLSLLLVLQHGAQAAGPDRETLLLDRGWLFHLGDITPPEVNGHGATYMLVKAGQAPGAAGTEFDDSGWRSLDLPHDWAVEGPFDASANMDQGYRPRGVGWYRRYLRIEPGERGRDLELQFDGIATEAQIWFNGHLLRRSHSGYSASLVDITPFVRYGDEVNTIAIRVDARPMEGWWYEGAGIYRQVRLVKRDALHLVTDGLHVTPQPLAGDRWTLPMVASLANSGARAAQATAEVRLFDPNGRLVAKRSQRVRLAALATVEIRLPMTVQAPQHWSPQQPRLYRVELRLHDGPRPLDNVSLQTGFRSLRFDADSGLLLNGQPLKLQGVCVHQDHAGVGVAVPEAIWAFRLRRLKELGANAVRFAHHAPAPEVLDLADRLGLLVMDENRNFNPAPETLGQLQWMVRRDRHHPSVILWSVFNEEPVQGSEVGYEMARRMVSAVKALDTTRPVTAAMNGGFFSPLNVSQAVDVVGFNYQPGDYDKFHAERPRLPATSSEDTSAFMIRGEFASLAGQPSTASYDDDFAPWGLSHRQAWSAIAARPWLAGGFVWTGFDYRGEPTPLEWPAVSSVFGIMDLNGFAKTAYGIHQVQWIRDRPVLHLAPHWNWPGREGQPIRVMVMGNMAEVALLLNGRELGRQAVDPQQMNFFQVPYAPGRLEAVGYQGGHEVAREVVETTGPAVALELLPDRPALAADGQDAMPITLRALDAQGRPVPTADALLSLKVSGAGRSLGHGNGDPRSHEDEKGPSRRLFNGLAQLIVQGLPDVTAGEILVEARAEGLRPAQLRLPLQAVAQRPASVPLQGVPLTRLRDWRFSPVSAVRPDPLAKLDDQDMNTWGWGTPPMHDAAQADARWRAYRTQFTPRANLADGRARLRFAAIEGRAEVWLDGQLLGRKTEAGLAPFEVPLPAGPGQHRLMLLIEGQPGQAAGLKDGVWLE